MKKFVTTLATILTATMLFTACGQGEKTDQSTTVAVQTTSATSEESSAAASAEEVSLADWNGDWNNITAYLDDPAMQSMLEEHAKEDKTSVDEVKKELAHDKEIDFKAMKIDGDKITYFDGFTANGGKEIGSNTYKYVDKYKATHGKHEFFWYEFKANEADAKYPCILIMPIHGEESLTHFHVRFGKDAQELLKKDDWFPTFVKSNSAIEQIQEEFAEHDHDHEHGHDHEHEHDHEHAAAGESFKLSDWDGTWNNMGAYLSDKGLDEAFEALAKKEEKSVQEAKKAYEEKRKCDFNGMVIEGDKVTFLDNFKDKDGKEISSAEYEFVGTHKTTHGKHELVWAEFKAKDANAKYPVLLMMPIHGEESLTHFHLRYGKDAEEMLKIDGWYPTFVKPSSTIEQLAEEISE